MQTLTDISLWLPFPPTSNTMFGLKGYRRFPSQQYMAWRDDADEALNQQETAYFDGPVSISISLRAPTRRKWDLDNRVKPILDLLVGHGIIDDDHTEIVRELIVNVGHQVGAEITIRREEKTAAQFPERRLNVMSGIAKASPRLLGTNIGRKGIRHKGREAQRAAGTPRCTDGDAGGTATLSRRDRSSMRGPIRVARS